MCSGAANKWRTRQRAVFDLFSTKSFFGELLGHVITQRGQFLVSRTGDDPPLSSTRVYVQNVPCVPAPHPRVFTHVDVLPVHTGALRLCGVWVV